MGKNAPTLFIIPVEDKFIIYAPLLQFAFVGNRGIVNLVNQKLNQTNADAIDNELINFLEKAGLFKPDKKIFPSFSSSQPFNPALCILMPTTACNLACTYCYAAYHGKKPSFLSWPVAKKAIDIAFSNSLNPANGKFSLSFHGGGEPTLNKEVFFKAAEYARVLDPGCPISVTTNAVWDNQFRERALKIISEISVSIDGNETTQNRQRPDMNGNATFTSVMETIFEIERRKISYGIRMTVTKESLPELMSNIEFLCNNTACRSFQIEAVYNQGRAQGRDLAIDDVDTFVDTFMDVYRYARNNGRNIHYSAARPYLITNKFCAATENAMILTSEGELTACYEVFDHSHLLADDFIIGKIDTNHGIVLYPGKRETLLEKIRNNRNSCKNCFCYYHCAGDCPPKAFLAQINNDNFRCSVTRAITRELILDRIETEDGFWLGDGSRIQQCPAAGEGKPCLACEKQI